MVLDRISDSLRATKQSEKQNKSLASLEHRRGLTGSGFGLAISKSIVEAHRGRIWAESDEGQGTRVFFAIRAAVFARGDVEEAAAAAFCAAHDRRA